MSPGLNRFQRASNYYQKATDTHHTGFFWGFFAVACFAEFVIQPCLCKMM